MGWFIGGLAIGLGGAAFLFLRGYMPSLPEPTPEESRPDPRQERPLVDSQEEEKPRYDFFTVLPEMEVVVPDRELESQAEPDNAAPAAAADSAEQFILQAGSFRSASDAEQMKARLALLGTVADIQTVTVNDQTWHRVRLGPVDGARAADQLRRQLQDNGIEVLVLKASG